MGKQAIDSDASQTPQILASLLKLPQACFASKLEVLDGGKVRVTREIDGGLETVEIPTPCVISTDLRLNEPRYASLPGIMKAKKKPLEEITLASLGLEGIQAKIRVRKLSLPPKRQAGKKVDSVAALVSCLKNEAKVL
jgi:electron transfer flavoprotein beta subunit